MCKTMEFRPLQAKKNWCPCKRRLTRTWLNFSVNFQAHFIYKDPIFLSAQRHSEVSLTHFQALDGVLEIFHQHWELTAHFLDLNVWEDTFSNWGVFMGYFGETQSKSGMYVQECEYEEPSRKLDLWPILDCHQSVAKPRARHFLPLLHFPPRGVKIMTLCLSILFYLSKRETEIIWKEFRQSVKLTGGLTSKWVTTPNGRCQKHLQLLGQSKRNAWIKAFRSGDVLSHSGNCWNENVLISAHFYNCTSTRFLFSLEVLLPLSQDYIILEGGKYCESNFLLSIHRMEISH